MKESDAMLFSPEVATFMSLMFTGYVDFNMVFPCLGVRTNVVNSMKSELHDKKACQAARYVVIQDPGQKASSVVQDWHRQFICQTLSLSPSLSPRQYFSGPRVVVTRHGAQVENAILWRGE